jgi:hypothetical protein
MLILDRMLVGGLRFVLDKLVQAVDSELNDEGALREELLRAQMQHELGEISSEDLARVELEIMDRLREILERKGGGGPIAMGGGTGEEDLRVASVEATFGGDEEPPPEPPGSKGRPRR